jgi:putative peptidoglycan lipid II flippase
VPRSPVAAAWELLHRFVPRGAILLSTLTFIGYFLGLVRERILSQSFGLGDELDAFKAAFLIPELLFSVIVASGLAAPFIPIFVGLKRDEGERAAHQFGQTILTLAVLVMGIVSVVLFLVAPLTADVAASGFSPAKRELYTDLFRVMAFTQVLFAGSMALGEVLVAERRFFFYGAAPLLYNLGIVIGTMLLVDAVGIFAPAVGAVLGASMHLGIRLIGISRTTFRTWPRLQLRTAAIREFFRLLLPKTGGGPIDPLTFIFFTNLASTMVVGSVTVVDQARNFQSLPVSLIGVTFALATFPALAARYAAHDRGGFTALVLRNSLTIGLLTTAAAAALIVLGPLGIDILLGGGEFGPDDVARLAQVLAVFALSIPFESLGHLLSRAIYATHHTLWQVGATVVGFVVTIVVALTLAGSLGVIAIPLAFTIGSAARCVLLAAVLARRIRRMPAGPPTATPTDAGVAA